MTMTPLDKKEQAELKRLTRKIRTGKATQREFLRAISLTNREHANMIEQGNAQALEIEYQRAWDEAHMIQQGIAQAAEIESQKGQK